MKINGKIKQICINQRRNNMELKTKYQYTYFIYPYIINENKYDKYISKLLNNKNLKVRFFEKEKDLDI